VAEGRTGVIFASSACGAAELLGQTHVLPECNPRERHDGGGQTGWDQSESIPGDE